MRSDDIAALLVEGMQSQIAGNTDMGWHTGVITSWDDTTGLNSVLIAGNTFNNLSVITPGSVVSLDVGNTVAIIRIQSKYFILGKVAAAGAGAALRPKVAQVNANQSTSSASYVDLTTVGPQVSVYIGPSRSCLVMVSCTTYTATNAGSMSFQVTGASSIAPNGVRGAWLSGPHPSGDMSASVSQPVYLTAADGLNQGTNTFTAKYASPAGGGVDFETRVLAVTPY